MADPAVGAGPADDGREAEEAREDSGAAGSGLGKGGGAEAEGPPQDPPPAAEEATGRKPATEEAAGKEGGEEMETVAAAEPAKSGPQIGRAHV